MYGGGNNLVKALEKLTEHHTVEGEGSTSGRGREIVPHRKVVRILELKPNEIKLEGATKYFRLLRRALKRKMLDEHMSDEAVESTNNTPTLSGKKWSAINYPIMAFMLKTLVPLYLFCRYFQNRPMLDIFAQFKRLKFETVIKEIKII
jgi:hypothetical protein